MIHSTIIMMDLVFSIRELLTHVPISLLKDMADCPVYNKFFYLILFNFNITISGGLYVS